MGGMTVANCHLAENALSRWNCLGADITKQALCSFGAVPRARMSSKHEACQLKQDLRVPPVLPQPTCADGQVPPMNIYLSQAEWCQW